MTRSASAAALRSSVLNSVATHNRGAGYLSMIEFFFVSIRRYPALRHARYIMRLDGDGYLVSRLPNLFQIMETLPQVSYVALADNYDCGRIVFQLGSFASAFAHRHNRTGAVSHLLRYDRHLRCVFGFYNNFEVINVDAFSRSPLLRKWEREVVNSRGIFHYRWGDAVLRRLGIEIAGLRYLYLDEIAPESQYCHGSPMFLKASGVTSALCYGRPRDRIAVVAPGRRKA